MSTPKDQAERAADIVAKVLLHGVEKTTIEGRPAEIVRFKTPCAHVSITCTDAQMFGYFKEGEPYFFSVIKAEQ